MSVGLSPSDFIAIPQFAWNVYKACRDSTGDYAALSSEVQSMHAMLVEVRLNAEKCNLSAESTARLAFLMSGCRNVLELLDTALRRFDSLASTGGSLKLRSRRTKYRVLWIMESPADIRLQLISHTAMLAVFNSSLVNATLNSTQDRIQSQLAEIFNQLSFKSSAMEVPQRTGEETSLPPVQAQIGLVQSCWGCTSLARTCGPANPCPSCIMVDPRFSKLPCRRGPLTPLSKDLNPEFFKVSQHLTGLSRITSASDQSKSGNEGRVLVNWGFIKMELPFHTSVRQLDAAFWSSVPEAIEDFQTTFPDEHGFRVQVIDEAMDFADSVGENPILIRLASKFLVLALIISHQPHVHVAECSYHQSKVASQPPSPQDYLQVVLQLQYSLAQLLEETLREVLKGLTVLIFRRSRRDWPIICLSLCLLFFGVESMQVDVYLRKRDAEEVCQAMEMNAVKVLAELFHASTSGLDPISLDWDLDDNKALLDHDINIIAAMQKLQELSQDYWTFLQERKRIRFSTSDTDCFTGKLVSEILT